MRFLHRLAGALGVSRPPGARIGRYQVIRRLAEGGMGEIFLARARGRKGFQKVVVLKRILRHSMANREAVHMFLDEARLMASLNHPNIVQVYDFGTAAGSHFFTMEYIHGEDLGRIARAVTLTGQPLSLAFALGVIAEAAAGLHYAHEKRGADGRPLEIVHRDISPSNILVSYEGAVKVTDFGIAKWAQRETETRYGALKGKIAYMSPEQCRGQALDRRSDVFGLGILLYELTTATRLFQGTSDFAVLEQIVNQETPRPSQRRPDYPFEVERIVMQALEKDPDRRQLTAQMLQRQLEELALQARLKLSALDRAAEMEVLFGSQIEAWREAAQAGRSLGEHLATAGADNAGPSRTITAPEAGASPSGRGSGSASSGARVALAQRRKRRMALSLGALALIAAGASAAVLSRPSRPLATAPPRPSAVVELEEEPREARARTEAPPSLPVDRKPSAGTARPRKKSRAVAARSPSPQPVVAPQKTKASAPARRWDPDSIFLP